MTTAATVTVALRCVPSASARRCSTVSCPSACGRSDRWRSQRGWPSVAWCSGSGASRLPFVPPPGGDGHQCPRRSDPGCC
uniref:Putative secreted protein n=1 Tax=Anopheles triannulatus TaxID=58253 RepID=A0A2M4B2K5_9DIPT